MSPIGFSDAICRLLSEAADSPDLIRSVPPKPSLLPENDNAKISCRDAPGQCANSLRAFDWFR